MGEGPGRDGQPRYATIVARTRQGQRFVAHVPGDEQQTLAMLTSPASEPIGSLGRASPQSQAARQTGGAPAVTQLLGQVLPG